MWSLEWMAMKLSLSLGLPVIGSPWGRFSSTYCNGSSRRQIQQAFTAKTMMILHTWKFIRKDQAACKWWFATWGSWEWKVGLKDEREEGENGVGLNTKYHATKRSYLSSTNYSLFITSRNFTESIEGYANCPWIEDFECHSSYWFEVKQFDYAPIPRFLRIPYPAQYLLMFIIENARSSLYYAPLCRSIWVLMFPTTLLIGPAAQNSSH